MSCHFHFSILLQLISIHFYQRDSIASYPSAGIDTVKLTTSSYISSPDSYLALTPLFADMDFLVPLDAEFYALSPHSFSKTASSEEREFHLALSPISVVAGNLS